MSSLGNCLFFHLPLKFVLEIYKSLDIFPGRGLGTPITGAWRNSKELLYEKEASLGKASVSNSYRPLVAPGRPPFFS